MTGAGGRSSGGTSAAGTAGSGASGLGGAGAVTPVLSAPDPRRTPPTACTVDGWCGSLGDYAAIWGSSLFDIWVAANNVKNDKPSAINAPETPVLLHWDGLQWTTIELLDAQLVKLTSIWGSSPNDIWVTGTPAYVKHYDGKSWSRSFLPTGSPLEVDSIWGTGPADVWTGGFDMFHFDGQAWSRRPGDLSWPVSAVWTAPGEVWVVSNGQPRRSQDSGQTWYPAPPNLNPSLPLPAYTWTALWSPRAGAPFAAGRLGALGRWTGAAWEVQSFAGEDNTPDFDALSGLSSEDVWAVGSHGGLAHWDGKSWAQQTSPTTETLRGVWGTDGQYFAVGDAGTFLALTRGEWIRNRANTQDIKAIWGGAPDDVWAVGKDTIHWDGTSWAQVDALVDLELSGVWGSVPSDVWAVGKQGTLFHFDGTQWAPSPSPTSADITGVWGSRGNDVWAVDASGEFLHFDGQGWALWATEDFGPLAAVYGNRTSDVVAVGQRSRVHFDGQQWSRLPLHPSQFPEYVTAFGDGTNVFIGGMVLWNAYEAGGATPELGRWDGTSIFDNLEPTWGGDAVVASGWANGQTDVWIAVPMLAHWNGTDWTKGGTGSATVGVSALGATSEDIWAATVGGPMLQKRRN